MRLSRSPAFVGVTAWMGASTAALLVLLSCADEPGAGGSGETPCSDPLELEFQPDTLGTDEAYVCFGYDSTAFGDETVAAVRWSIPSEGQYLLHHAILYAIPDDFPAGPSVCDAMSCRPGRVSCFRRGRDASWWRRIRFGERAPAPKRGAFAFAKVRANRLIPRP
jgi:hypothetical protein